MVGAALSGLLAGLAALSLVWTPYPPAEIDIPAKLRLQELEGEALDRAKNAARATDDYVHDHPWRAVGAAAVVGFVIGLMMNRR